jgi:Tfp pilus assembly PilM family ATPase
MGSVVQALSDAGVKPEETIELLKKLTLEPQAADHPSLPLLERKMQETLYTLGEEFRRSEFFVKDQKRLEEVNEIYLCGGGACTPYTVQYLQTHLSEKTIQTLNPFQWMKQIPPGFDEVSGPLWACALGLSLRDIR